ncbi:GRIP domain protein [Dictyocaulus viviparus]|uniref:GRIP domain protein n=1 Tax=Dictyocaulus viviparus TaxID=29172 RepID=A0A0D8Y5H8_DICVI|nr:GRIP domain protein [Dictyocaulus viviparus]
MNRFFFSDVVRAYKSLDAEKSALQSALDLLTSEKTDDQCKSPAHDETSESGLKAALTTLTRESSRKEAAFLNDKKQLLKENASLKENLSKTHESLLNAEKTVKIQEIEVDREKELLDHGKVVAEMQNRYVKDHQLRETEAKEKEETISQLKARETQLLLQVSTLNKEVRQLRDKDQHAPSIQILKDEMANLKVDHEKELLDAIVKTRNATQLEEQDRSSAKIAELEEKTRHLLEAVARSEEARNDAYEALLRSQSEKAVLSRELSMLNKCQDTEETSDAVSRLQSAVIEIREGRPDFDISSIIGPDPEKARLQSELAKLKDEYDQCKLRLDTLAAYNEKLPLNVEGIHEESFRAVVEQFQGKIQNLIALHAEDKSLHEKASRDLHARILELEQRDELRVVEMRREINSRISEMETEMQKQRSRTVDVLAEKERELEAAKFALASLRNEQGMAPSDPLQASKVVLSRKISSEHKGSRRSVDAISVNSVDGGTDYQPYSIDDYGFPVAGMNESRNIFYEEELLKKEREIQELRQVYFKQSVSHQHSYRLREMEQTILTKELEHHKTIEAMCDEIAKLRNKLALLSTGGEIEYIRNIFVQFIQSSNSSARKSILKAMGMALKLSANELKAIDSR